MDIVFYVFNFLNKPVYLGFYSQRTKIFQRWMWSKKFFQNKRKTKNLKLFVSGRPALQYMLKEIHKAEENRYQMKPWIFPREWNPQDIGNMIINIFPFWNYLKDNWQLKAKIVRANCNICMRKIRNSKHKY